MGAPFLKNIEIYAAAADFAQQMTPWSMAFEVARVMRIAKEGHDEVALEHALDLGRAYAAINPETTMEFLNHLDAIPFYAGLPDGVRYNFEEQVHFGGMKGAELRQNWIDNFNAQMAPYLEPTT